MKTQSSFTCFVNKFKEEKATGRLQASESFFQNKKGEKNKTDIDFFKIRMNDV